MTRSGKKQQQKRLDPDASIAIVGCGIAGLSAAISLVQAGFTNVHIYERDADPTTRREGFGMTLTYNPKGPLHHCGILEQVAQQDCPSRCHYIFDPSGKVLGYFGNAFLPSRGFGQRGNMRIPRQTLQKIMTERLLQLIKDQQQQHNNDTIITSGIHWNQCLCSIQQLEAKGKVQIEFRHQQERQEQIITQQSTTTIVVDSDLVIAADGVRSSVVSMLAPHCQPRPLNVRIVLGIAKGCHHPLLTERGFYTIGDGKHRLFTMPYEGDRFASTERRIMWQLSYRFNENSHVDETCSNSQSPQVLLETVMEKCSQWHEPVPALLKATPLETVWGTSLMDRDPMALKEAFQSFPRVVVVGDALHAMSPFKGQGANQALLDGPLVADWLQRARVDAAVRGIWREAVARTDKVVQSSREAAEFWHSAACTQQQQDLCKFAGVKEDACSTFLETLSRRHITAHLSSELDSSIRSIIEELGVGTGSDVLNRAQEQDGQSGLQEEIMGLADRGSTAELRNVSLSQPAAVQSARDTQGRSALHLAARSGHYQTCRWLLTEALVDPWTLDSMGRSPLDEATDPRVKSLLQKGMQNGTTS
ncbi:FAD binding domain-containing protein [Seminavis robusta]|uniref:FAD binding domain-containing protein n=1 Tax=Seminavis robusta TaxID=568900 RepID=A0A9N8H6Q5_9STRA|nr:FAD binding domain-containing protein [Seminavis robusta]|eukprot:Sro154_g070200.1 FAD binding domain-containing protein (589) ;mRNA; r:90181-92053